MKKATKAWLIAGVSLVIVGMIMFISSMAKYKWDFTELSTERYETNTYDIINEKFENLSISTDTADIVLALSDDGKCRVVCYEEEKAKHSVTVKNDMLTIEQTDKKSWYDGIGIDFDSPKITVYLPQSEYSSLYIDGSVGTVEIPKEFKFKNAEISLSTSDINFSATASEIIKIETSTGNINLKSLSAGKLDLSSETGEITVSNTVCKGEIKITTNVGVTKLTNIKCENFISIGYTGDISLRNVCAEGKLSIERSTGCVNFDKSDAAEISVKTDTGDITGSLLSEKVFVAQSDTGDVNVPKTTSGGKCVINTDNGNVRIELSGDK